MAFVIDLMENRVARQRYERGLAEGEAKAVARGEAPFSLSERIASSGVGRSAA